MNASDHLRGLTVRAVGAVSVPAAGFTGAAALVTPWISTRDLVGPVTFTAYVEQHAQLSGTFSLESAATNAAVAANAGTTVTDAADFTDNTGVNNTGGFDFVAADGLDAALSYIGDAAYVRGHLTLNNSSGVVARDVTVAGLAQPQITPDR